MDGEQCDHTTKTSVKYGIIDERIHHLNFLSEDIGSLLCNDCYSDVIFRVENDKFFGHKIILATRCEYFRALLFGGMRESKQDEIEITDCAADIFRIILEYIYTGFMTLNKLTHYTILDVLIASRKYGINKLEESITSYLIEKLSVENCCLAYDVARIYDFKLLLEKSISFIENNVTQILRNDSFLRLSLDSVEKLLKMDTFFAPELDIFEAVRCWIHVNDDISMENRTKLLNYVRYPIIDMKDLILTVKPTGLISSDTILNVIEGQLKRSQESRKQHRGRLLIDQNMATKNMGALLLTGEGKDSSNLFSENVKDLKYDENTGYIYHSISQSLNNPGIVIQLGNQCFVNHIKMLLWDKDSRSYSYYIEVSVDQEDWIKIVDYAEYPCRSWQHLSFPKTVVKYIRIVGTSNTENGGFHVVHFEIMYSNEIPFIEDGLIVPKCNIATCDFGATVAEGFSNEKNSLQKLLKYNVNGDIAFHYLNYGGILIQLGQPYLLDSMRFLLRDVPGEVYKYTVEVSVDREKWELLSDELKMYSSWQTLRFERKPVVLIRIRGILITTDVVTTDVFHVIHFECPAQTEETHLD